MASLLKIMDDYKDRLMDVATASAKDTAGMMIGQAPVLSGSLVLSFTGTINGSNYNDVTLPVPEEATLPWGLWINPKEQAYKATAKSNADQSIVGLKAGDSFTFISGKPYGPEVEHDVKSYYKDPQGFVWTSAAEWKPIVNKRARKARGN